VGESKSKTKKSSSSSGDIDVEMRATSDEEEEEDDEKSKRNRFQLLGKHSVIEHDNKNVTVTSSNEGDVMDFSTSGKTLSQKKIKIGHGWMIQFGKVSYKGKAGGINDSLILKRLGTSNPFTGKETKDYVVNLPINCLGPLQAATTFLLHESHMRIDKKSVDLMKSQKCD